MPLSAGTRIGPYTIADSLGVGGMGEVYRAVDANLGRAVAIKVLPDAFARDAERLARFEREARTLASLNHPNIAQVYGLETRPDDAETRALVMELVEGPTLADRIAAGTLALDEAIPIAVQIADALEAAHEQGIVHRDLKPANVKVRADGTVKVLDFGLAKAMEPGQGSGVRDQGSGGRGQGPGTLANSPTITTPAMTQAGVILGTAAYMSPEQAKGRAVDRRADIWAFGCVLYEMLTGTRAFKGDDISDVLVSVLRDEPAWQALPATTPAHVRSVLRRCLQKEPKRRLPHIGSARLELAEGDTETVSATVAPPARGRVVERVALLAAGAAVAAGAVFSLRPAASPADQQPAVRFEIAPPDGGTFPGGNGVPRFAVSPDGQMLVYQASMPGGTAYLWMRRLADIDAQPLPGTESGLNGLATQQPFWSPDGRFIAFFDEGTQKLKRYDLQSRTVQVLADVPGNQFGGTWNAAGDILFATTATKGVMRLAASGGAPTPVTTLDAVRREAAQLWPHFLPDGRRFLYLSSTTGDEPAAAYVATLDGGAPRRLLSTAHMVRLVPPNRLLFLQDDTLVAQTVDLDRLAMTGSPVRVLNGVMRTAAGRVAISESGNGVVVYAAGPSADDSFEAIWVDRRGAPLDAPPIAGLGFRLSSDGRLLAFSRAREVIGGVAFDLWTYDVARQIPTRLSAEAAGGLTWPVFAPDGSGLIYRRNEDGGAVALVEQPVSGASPGVPVYRTQQSEVVFPYDWSPDGRFLLFAAARDRRRGLWLLPLSSDRTPVPYLVGENDPDRAHGAFSPDGRWVAYTTDPSISPQVFVQPFPDPSGGRWPVSKPGSTYPRWRRDGREIYFVDVDGQLWAAPVSTASQLTIGEPAPLFRLPYFVPGRVGFYPYDVAPDGQRFLVIRPRGTTSPVRLTVAVNWLEPPAESVSAAPR